MIRMFCFCCFLYLKDVAAKYNFEKKYFGQTKEFYIIAEVYYLSIYENPFETCYQHVMH